jgi:hypothetical protein
MTAIGFWMEDFCYVIISQNKIGVQASAKSEQKAHLIYYQQMPFIKI